MVVEDVVAPKLDLEGGQNCVEGVVVVVVVVVAAAAALREAADRVTPESICSATIDGEDSKAERGAEEAATNACACVCGGAGVGETFSVENATDVGGNGGGTGKLSAEGGSGGGARGELRGFGAGGIAPTRVGGGCEAIPAAALAVSSDCVEEALEEEEDEVGWSASSVAAVDALDAAVPRVVVVVEEAGISDPLIVRFVPVTLAVTGV